MINRRQFIGSIVDKAKHAAILAGAGYGLGSLPVSQIMKLLGVSDPLRAALTLREFGLSEADAATLPINYISRPFLVHADADIRNGIADLTTNALVSGTGTSAGTDNTDTTLIKNGGSKNIQVQFGGGGAGQLHHCLWDSAGIDMNLVPTHGIRIYAPMLWDSSANTASRIYSNAANASTNNFRYQMNLMSYPSLDTIATGWQFFQSHRKETTTTNGAPSWASPILSIVQQIRGVDAANTLVYLDQLYYDGYQHPVIPWIFDGGSDTHYSVAYALWATYGLQGTIAIPTSLVDTTNFLTTAMIDTMYAAGWDVVHMTDTTTALTGLTVSAVETRLATAEAYLISKGWTRTLKHCVLPGSLFTTSRTDANARTALAKRGYLSAVNKWQDGTDGSLGVNAMAIDPVWGISLNPYLVPAWRVENPDTPTESLAHVNHAIAAGGPRLLRSGPIAGVGTAGQLDVADHASLLAHLALRHHAGTLTVAPYRKFYAGLSGRILRS